MINLSMEWGGQSYHERHWLNPNNQHLIEVRVVPQKYRKRSFEHLGRLRNNTNINIVDSHLSCFPSRRQSFELLGITIFCYSKSTQGTVSPHFGKCVSPTGSAESVLAISSRVKVRVSGWPSQKPFINVTYVTWALGTESRRSTSRFLCSVCSGPITHLQYCKLHTTKADKKTQDQACMDNKGFF